MGIAAQSRPAQAGAMTTMPGDPTTWFTAEFWNERYRSAEHVWSGNPNPQLVAQVAGLVPGTALDVGSGEGADAIWLARQGWQVTGLDVSQVALDRAAGHAVAAALADRITWRQTDLLTWEPGEQRYDLVSAQFVHLPGSARELLYGQLAELVAPGGTLLIVGHHPADDVPGRPNVPGALFTAEELAERLDPAQWEVAVASAPGREVVDAEGHSRPMHDAVLRAVRRSA
jgi:SAM-dependent methyltransferase